ncbi:MAG: hypothetical protein HWE34_12770 [Methylocystaceae bacterium]|nr:hypothetical protein [Methylocystaceae bacterium]
MTARELEVIFNGVYALPENYREALSKAMSWQAMCYLLNGLSLNLSELVWLDERTVDGIG